MESCEDSRGAGQQKECVKVAVNIRPLITSELLLGCADCVSVVPGEPQVLLPGFRCFCCICLNSRNCLSFVF